MSIETQLRDLTAAVEAQSRLLALAVVLRPFGDPTKTIDGQVAGLLAWAAAADGVPEPDAGPQAVPLAGGFMATPICPVGSATPAGWRVHRNPRKDG